ncbi:putative General substrate transporter [Seiridium cardinale]|uniref:General substrate transporter n=1 Tax=Seiridium cardinale TaxID=138064 RepID=A0ABR2XC64_9PEZI
MKEFATIPSFRNMFLLGAIKRTVAKWSGGNGITVSIVDIFQYAGIAGGNSSLITSGAYGAVKLVFTTVFTWGCWTYSVGEKASPPG